MKALVKARAEPGIWMEDVAEPGVGHNDVLIRVRKTAICGTDIHIYDWDEWAQRTIPVPMAVGHEFVGEIVEVGSEVTGLKPGDRVSGEGHITCGYCRNCRAGRRHLCMNTNGVGIHGTREDNHQAIAEVLDLLAAVPCDRVTQEPEVCASKFLGRVVSDPVELLGRANEVGE